MKRPCHNPDTLALGADGLFRCKRTALRDQGWRTLRISMCAAPERFRAQTFVPGAGDETVDCGAMCLPGLAERVHSLVQDAAAAGARIVAGGALPESGATSGQFYPPTVVADVTPAMRLFREEAFGPVMTICKAVRAPSLALLQIQKRAGAHRYSSASA